VNLEGGPILHISETIKGGIASYLDEVGALQIDEFGLHGVRFVIPRNSLKELPSIPEECLIPVDYDGRTIANLCSYTIQIFNILKSNRFSLIHAHSTFAGFVTRLLRAGRVFRSPVLYCAHGWSFIMDVSERRKRAYAIVERVLAHFTEAIINISQFEHDSALLVGLPADKCHLILSGVGPTRQQRRLVLPASRINLLFAGRLDYAKGADILLEAMKRLSRQDIHLYMAGEAVLDACAVADAENVTMLGWLSREELDAYYAAVDALVMPSRWEGFGLSAIEAMRQSTAVIASDRGALPEIVVPGVTGLIVPGDDPQTLADLLEGLDKARLRQWGKAGFERQQALFSSSRVHSQLCEIYSALISGTASPAICSNVSRGPAIS